VLILEEVVVESKEERSVVKPFGARRRGSLLSEVKCKCRHNLRAIGARSVCLFEQDDALCFYCSYNLAALHTAVL
jgi:hypothetical protein